VALGFFLVPYRHRPLCGRLGRVCGMVDFDAQIRADGGAWREVEILGDRAIVKVRATAATLDAIAAVTGVQRIPLERLDDSLSTLPRPQLNTIRKAILECGYTTEELNARLPDLSVVTLRDVLRFLATRRLKPRYTDATRTAIVCDGPVLSCGSVEALDADVV